MVEKLLGLNIWVEFALAVCLVALVLGLVFITCGLVMRVAGSK